MKTSDRLALTFNLNNELVHRPKKCDFSGVIAGDVVAVAQSPEPFTGTGYDLAQSIRIAEQHVARWQAAIDNMRRILDEAEPYTPNNTGA